MGAWGAPVDEPAGASLNCRPGRDGAHAKKWTFVIPGRCWDWYCVWRSLGMRPESKGTRGLIVDPNNDLVFSVASLWEIAI